MAMMRQHTETSTIFYNFDQLRLWLVQNKDTAISETQENIAAVLELFGITEYTPPPAEPVAPWVPTSITMRQARLQLAILGLYESVNTAVGSMGELAQIEWEYAATVDRSNALTTSMVQMLGWTEQQTDDYFTAASAL